MLAIDVGNSRVKLGWFDRPAECEATAQAAPLPIAGPTLPEPTETITISPPLAAGTPAAGALEEWLATRTGGGVTAIGSVNRLVASDLVAVLRESGFAAAGEVVRLESRRLPIEARVDEPERVGVDRLLGAVAANRLRRPDRAAVVVDLGTAITVDLIAPDGAFEGGAILPGIGMAARALSEQTDALPQSPLAELDASPDAVGRSTGAAIEAGLFWGAVGAVRELIDRQSDRLTAPPQVLLTGGAAPSVARLLAGPDRPVRYLPHLVLSGIAIAAGERERR